MTKLTYSVFLIIAFLAIQAFYVAAENKHEPTPPWIEKVKDKVKHTFKVQVTLSEVERIDHLDGISYQMYRIEGQGNLSAVPRPFEGAHDVFFNPNAEDAWHEDFAYSADGHASASFGFRRANQLCLSSIWLDSSDQDAETDHFPSKFWVSVDCREMESSD